MAGTTVKRPNEDGRAQTKNAVLWGSTVPGGHRPMGRLDSMELKMGKKWLLHLVAWTVQWLVMLWA